MPTVIQIDGYDPVAGAAVTIAAASDNDPAVCHLNGATWWPVIAKLPTLRYDLFDGAFAGQIVAPSSSLSMGIEPWPNFGRYALADARFRLWTGNSGDSWGAWTLRFDGRLTAQPKIKGNVADIDFAVDDRWLDKALLPTFAGTTGAEGPAALKGQVKPLAFGAPRYVSGVLVDATNSVFAISHTGLHAVEAALERLARYGSSIGDYASYSALVAASIPAGRWGTSKAAGMVRLGAPPVGQISFLVQGEDAGPDGWVRTPGRIINRIALLAGGSGKIDTASLTALDTARPYNLSLYLDEQTTARDLIQRIAASINCVAGVSWTGQLFVAPVGIGTPTVTLAADGSAIPQVASVEQIEIAAPWAKLAIGAERAWTVHALSDIAFTAPLIDMGPYDGTKTYREGNIVQSAGASFIYINPTPTAGNAPPNVSYWREFAAAGADGADGAPGANGGNAFTMVAQGNGVVTPTTAGYSGPGGGTYDFTGGGRSVESYPGAVCSAMAGASFAAGAFGLTLQSKAGLTVFWTRLDLGWQLTSSATCQVVESGTVVAGPWSRSASDVFAVRAFNTVGGGATIQYLQNGTVRYERTQGTLPGPLFFDAYLAAGTGTYFDRCTFTAAAEKGKPGDAGASGSPAYPGVTVNATGVLDYPYPVKIEPGQAMKWIASVEVIWIGGTSTVSAEVQYFENGGGPYSFAGPNPTGSVTVLASDPDLSIDARGDITNTGASARILNLRLVVAQTGGGGTFNISGFAQAS